MTTHAVRKPISVISLRVGALSVLAGLGCAAAPAAFAAPDEDSAEAAPAQVFEPTFFDPYAPRSALDMVDQTPGFSIRENDGRRGMGAGDANVLIDSRRVPVKSMSIREALSRIDASRVVRIEVQDGARFDLPGLSGQVVNVITRPAGMSGRWEWNPEYNEGGPVRTERGRVVVSGVADEWQYSAGLSSHAWNGRSAGPEALLDGAGVQVESRHEIERWKGRRHELSTALTHEDWSGSISNAGLVLAAATDGRNETSFRQGAIAPGHLRTFTSGNESLSLKVNADHEFDLGAGRLKFIGLRATSDSAPATWTAIDYTAAAAPASGAQVFVDRSSEESILRGEYAWADSAGDWQMAVEGAVNTLDTSTAYAVRSNGGYVDVPVSGGSSHVEEKRTEAALIHGRELGDGYFLQASLAAEHSEIAQTGPNGKVREFVRPKGFLALSWAPAEDWSANLRLERAVGQLDFGDFVSSVNLADETGQQQSGNPEIVPEQSWNLALEANGEVTGLGPVHVKVYSRQIEDVNSTLLFSRTENADGSISVVEGPGNLDEAVTYGIDVSGTLPTAELGIPGGKLDWSASLRDSSVEDAVTGESRNISGTRHAHYSVNFRQDLPGTPWAWGVGYNDGHNAPGFGVTQVTRSRDAPGSLGAFVQHKDVIGMNARLSLSNLLDEEKRFMRIGHAGTVSDPVSFIEDRTRRQGLHVGLNLSGSF
jgi:outer membrane receptor for ferrienterochelin and colicins